MNTEKSCKKTSIGGQAVLEGIMMRGPLLSALSVRKPDGEIVTETWDTVKGGSKHWYQKALFIRGVFAFVDSLTNGYRCLMRSAELSGETVEAQESKMDRWIKSKFGEKSDSLIGALSLVFAVVLAVGLFMFLPMMVVKGIDLLIPLGGWKTLLEGVIKIGLFIGYVALCTAVKDVRRTFEYHGAEHKCIFTYEAGLPLTVENVKQQQRFHPRCGTSFLLIVFILSILVFSVVTWDSVVIRILLKLALLPVICGCSYELIKLAGRYTNLFTRIISAPGLWLQRLTTKEPHDDQIEVAINALSLVIPEDPELDNY